MAPVRKPQLKELKTPKAMKPNPSRGGHGFSQDVRTLYVLNPDIAPLYRPGVTPHPRTVARWRHLYANTGSFTGYERRGNKRPSSIVGRDKYLLLMFRSAFPRATAAEVAAFIFRNTLNQNPRIFTPSQITKAEDTLGLTRKRSATVALQAFRQENIIDRWMFWNLPYPFGRANIPVMSLIDVDECGIMVEQTNRHYGKSCFGFRVVEKGKYGRGVKWTVTLAVAASGERWCRVEAKAGTEAVDYVDFIQHILETISPDAYEGVRTILMDSLSAHRCPLVHQSIIEAHQQLLYRPKYTPADGPIEYVFNTLQAELRVRMRDINETNIAQHITAIVTGMQNFYPYFIHCGYGN